MWVARRARPARRRWLAVGLGLVATVLLIRMYSLFHDLTHNSLFASRAANRRWGRVLGFLLFTPYRWWQRQHSLHHAHTGNLDHRGPGEIYTMTARRVRARSWPAAARVPAVPEPAAHAVRRAEPRVPVRAALPAARHVPADPASVVATNLALAGWAIGWSALVGWPAFLLIQGTTLVAGGAVAAWMLYIQHQYEDTYYQAAGEWRFELAALQGSSYLALPRAVAWAVGNANYHHVHHLSARIPNYRLRAAHEEQSLFAQTPVVTVRSSLAALRLKLWDEERACLVRFPARRARPTAAPEPGRDRTLAAS